MPKQIKGLSTCKPPEPTDDHAPLDAWMRSQSLDDAQRPELRRWFEQAGGVERWT